MTLVEFMLGVPVRRRGDAVWLLSSLLKCSKADILLDSRRELSREDNKKIHNWWKRRLAGEPLQYIAGSAPFWGREFLVNKNVLIPRPETERLVELALELVKSRAQARVLDIGTGSGCIALTIKAERPELEVLGSDISAAALTVAKKNAKLLGFEVRLEKHDLFSPRLQGERWDLVVSNPPYLDFSRDKIAAEVKGWEPRIALEPRASARGQDRASWCAERILRACELTPPAFTVLELSPRVAMATEKRWRKRDGVERIWRAADLAGRKRFLLVAWNTHG